MVRGIGLSIHIIRRKVMENEIMANVNVNEVVGVETVTETFEAPIEVAPVNVKTYTGKQLAAGCAIGAAAGSAITVGGLLIGKLIAKRRAKKMQQKLDEMDDAFEEFYVEEEDVKEDVKTEE